MPEVSTEAPIKLPRVMLIMQKNQNRPKQNPFVCGVAHSATYMPIAVQITPTPNPFMEAASSKITSIVVVDQRNLFLPGQLQRYAGKIEASTNEKWHILATKKLVYRPIFLIVADDTKALAQVVRFSVARMQQPKLPSPSSSITVEVKFWHVFHAEKSTKKERLNYTALPRFLQSSFFCRLNWSSLASSSPTSVFVSLSDNLSCLKVGSCCSIS